MARVSIPFYDDENLPVNISKETFTFGDVVYLTVGGLQNSDTVVLHLNEKHLDSLQAAITEYKKENPAQKEAEQSEDSIQIIPQSEVA